MARARATTAPSATCGIAIGRDATCNARTTENADFCTRNERNRCVFANNPDVRGKKYTLRDIKARLGTATDRVRLNNQTIRIAVRDWIADPRSAQRRYGAISTWNTTDVTDMSRLFDQCTLFDEPLASWDTSNVVDMSYMFSYAMRFDQPIGHWVTSNVRDMSYMFTKAARFNQPIGAWEVGNVRNMRYMFSDATQFDQPIGTWDVSKVLDMSYLFSNATQFNQPIDTWDVSNVQQMGGMLERAKRFNQPLGRWVTRNVRNMSFMFYSAMRFNQPIGTWDMRNVQKMCGMFTHATAFDQSLSEWHTIPAETFHDHQPMYHDQLTIHNPLFHGAPWMMRRYPEGVITPKSPRERWATARRRVQERRDPRRFRWQRLCDANALHVDELRALATAADIPDVADMSKRALCAALSRRWANQKAEQARVAPQCNNHVGILQTPVQDIAPEFFYSYEQDGRRFCDDIRDLHTHVQSRPRAENPFTNVPYDAQTMSEIRAAYARVRASAERMDDFDDEPVVMPFPIQLTRKLADLMSKLDYPNDIELFRRASNVKFWVFVDALQSSGVVSPNDRNRIDEQADLDQQKAFLADLLLLKIAHDPDQAPTAHGPISRIAYEVSNVYNDLFV